MSIIVLLHLAVILLFAIIYSGNNLRQRDGVFLSLAFVLIFIVHAFKDPLSLPDTPEYLKGFLESGRTGWGTLAARGFKLHLLKAEPGYVFLNKLLASATTKPQSIFLLTSFIMLTGYYVAIRKYSLIPWLSVIIFLLTVFNMSLFVLRQFMAMSIMLFSFRYVVQRQLLPFLAVVLLAFTIHQTALVFIPVYFFYGVDNVRKLMLYILLVGFVVFLVRGVLLVLSVMYSVGYGGYLQSGGTEPRANATGSIILACVFGYRLYVLRKDFFEGTMSRLLSLVLTLGLVFSIIGIGLKPTNRLLMYYSAMGFLIMPDSLYKDTNKISKYFVGGIYLAINYVKFFQDDVLNRFQLIFTF